MTTQEQNRVESFKSLSALQAIEAWLCDDCRHGERNYLITAIQRDRRIELDDDEIVYVIQNAMENGIDAPTVFDHLLTVGEGFKPGTVRRLPAR
jgi:hypothetical protein